MATNPFSVVEYFYYDAREKYSCGYCKKQDAYKRHGTSQTPSLVEVGMWAHTLSVQDYQNLIDRGWRRSGMYCYKPVNDQTCCPLYTIRCEALNFSVSKSQKKIIKKMIKFLNDDDLNEAVQGQIPNRGARLNIPSDSDMCSRMESNYGEEKVRQTRTNIDISQNETMNTEIDCDETKLSQYARMTDPISAEIGKTDSTQVPTHMVGTSHLDSVSIVIPDHDIGPKKAKLMRIERARKRLLSQGKTLKEIEAIYRRKKQKNSARSIENLLSSMVGAKNKLELKLVRVSSEEFMETLDVSVTLFKKYQMAIHNDEPDECDKKSFMSFLGKSPLKHHAPESGPPHGYGSFHQQYWLNDKLMAVGVIDILPYCISSVYFFYDPDYSFLSLGTYSSFMEIKLTRELNAIAPDLKYYYMGYYINDIPKMKYKAKMKPSKLLCPETYVWRDIDSSISKLEKSKYSRLNENFSDIDEDGQIDIEALMQVRCYYRGRRFYRDIRNNRTKIDGGEDDIEEVREYAELVGKKCAHSMCLYRSY